MLPCQFQHVRLASLCTVVPQEEIRLEDELACYGGDRAKLERMKRIAGLDKRRIAPEGVTASDICIQAAERLLSETGVDRASIDTLIFVTQTPDYPAPASAFMQHKALGLGRDCAAFDVNLGCSGYVYGLWMAACMVESGARSRVLLLAGDAARLDPANRVVAPVFGDAGSASLVEYSEHASPLSFSLGTDGSGYEAIIRPGGGARIPHLPASPDEETSYTAAVKDANNNPWRVGGVGNIWMDGMAIFEFTMSVMPEHITAHLKDRGMRPDQVDYLVLHQANKQIVQSLGQAAGFTPEQVPWETVSKYGNQSCASIPGAICDQLREICREKSPLTLMLCGYGIGLSWASCIGDFTGVRCCGVHEFTPPADISCREDHINYWHKKFRGKDDG